jgi:hypothetical protein
MLGRDARPHLPLTALTYYARVSLVTLPLCHATSRPGKSSLTCPFFFSVAVIDGPFLCLRQGETNSSQVFAYMSSPMCALAIGLTPALFGARPSSNLELCPTTVLLKLNPTITEGASHRTILSQIGHTM